MGFDLDDAEAQAGGDMAHCTSCGGYDRQCKNPFHENNPDADAGDVLESAEAGLF